MFNDYLPRPWWRKHCVQHHVQHSVEWAQGPTDEPCAGRIMPIIKIRGLYIGEGQTANEGEFFHALSALGVMDRTDYRERRRADRREQDKEARWTS